VDVLLENGVVGQPATSLKQIISKGWTDCQFVVWLSCCKK
jgi:hypothetical protein